MVGRLLSFWDTRGYVSFREGTLKKKALSAYGCKYSILFVEHLFFKLKRRPINPQNVPVTGPRSAKNQVCHIKLCHKNHMIPTKKKVLNWTLNPNFRSKRKPPQPQSQKLVNLFCQLLGPGISKLEPDRWFWSCSRGLAHSQVSPTAPQLGVRNNMSVRRSSNPEMPGRKNSLTHEFQDLALL